MALHNRKEDTCCSIGFVKSLLIIYTCILMIAGGIVLATAIWTLLDRHQYVALLTSLTYPTLVHLLLGAGCLVIIVTILGCVAIAKERRVLLVIYIFLLLLIFVTEATVGIISYIYKEQVHNVLEVTLDENFIYYYGIDSSITFAVDFLQEEFNCCGVTTYRDWNNSIWYQDGLSNSNIVPDSCCITNTPNCGRRTHPSNVNHEGCLDVMESHLNIHLTILCAIGLGICVIQIFGIIYALILYCKLLNRDELYRRRERMVVENQKLYDLVYT